MSRNGKFLLEFAVHPGVDLLTATKIGIGSMLSTARANLSVGPPYDVGVYDAASGNWVERRLSADSPVLTRLQGLWSDHMQRIVAELPSVTVAEDA